MYIYMYIYVYHYIATALFVEWIPHPYHLRWSYWTHAGQVETLDASHECP